MINGTSATVKHLLNHSSGLTFESDERFEKCGILHQREIKFQEIYDILKDKKIEWQPGEKFKYNNTGYILLGEIIRRKSGTSFGSFMKQHVFEPLGLDSIQVDRPNGNVCEPLVWDSGLKDYFKDREILVRNTSDCFSDGNLYSKPSTYRKLVRSIIKEKILLSSSTIEKLSNSGIKIHGDNSRSGHLFNPVLLFDNYSFGLFTRRKNNSIYYGHTGNWIGYWSMFLYFPDLDVFLLVYSNLNYPKSTGKKLYGFHNLGNFANIFMNLEWADEDKDSN